MRNSQNRDKWPYSKRVSSQRQRSLKYPQKNAIFYEEKVPDPPSKCIYIYGEEKNDIEKTPMCRIAEIARFNKVKKLM